MKTIAHFVQTTVVGGVFFLAPIVVLIIILAKALAYAKKGLGAVLVYVPVASDLSAGAATTAVVCFLAGLVAHTVTAQRVIDALESSVLSKIPAYEYLKQESASALGVAHGRGMAARRSNRSAKRRPRLNIRPRRARSAFRLGLFLFDGHRSACRHQAGRCAQLPQAMWRRRFRDRRQLAGRGIAPPVTTIGLRLKRRASSRCAAP